MRLVHVSDLHIGFSRYDRLTRSGMNQIEADVAATFGATIERIIAVAPDIIVVGGDVFHSAIPTNRAILTVYSGFSRLLEALPGTPIVVAAGNHDLPATTAPGCIMELLGKIGVHVADRAAKRFRFPSLDLSVLAVPDAPGLVRPALTPDPESRFNVLVLHGEVQGMMPKGVSTEMRVSEIPAADIGIESWDYIALGHYHVYRELAPNMFYSGSIDYTSSNPWGEIAEQRKAGLSGKGFAERDLVTGAQTFHALPGARHWVDLPPIDGDWMSPEQLDAAIAAAVESCEGGIDDKVVRQVVRGVSRDIGHALDTKAIKRYKYRALHWNLDLRKREETTVLAVPTADASPAGSPVLTDEEMRELWGGDEDDSQIDMTVIARAPAVDDMVGHIVGGRGSLFMRAILAMPDPYLEAERLAALREKAS